MAKALQGRLTYANVMATLALFVALGGGAYAASGGLVSSSGYVQECVRSRGGVPRVVHAHARCSRGTIPRSEEHTSELQSQSNLVCRLLLEKKKKKKAACI